MPATLASILGVVQHPVDGGSGVGPGSFGAHDPPPDRRSIVFHGSALDPTCGVDLGPVA
jgi:hypothetical protein